MTKVSAYECFIKNEPSVTRIINAASDLKARYRFWLDVHDVNPNIRLIDVRSRKRGGPYTSPGFLRTAKERGVPHARCGDRVKVGESEGTIVGHNSSSNFDVLFDTGPYAGSQLNVHPSEITWPKEQQAA